MGGLTIFRSGYAAGASELNNRRRWARHLIRNGYECNEPVQMRTAAAAWGAAWSQLAALDIQPVAVTKGAYCRRVAGGSAVAFRAVWAFTRPPAGNAEHFRKLTEEEAVNIARQRWGVDGNEVALRQDSAPAPHRTADNKKRGSEEALVRVRHEANIQRAGDEPMDTKQGS